MKERTGGVYYSADVFLRFSSTAVRKEEHVVKAESPEEGKQLDEKNMQKKKDEVKEKKVVKQEVAKCF